ncbi:MAG: adenosylmethionine decarboxylase [Rhodoferax sp.]|nr:adenosylmethionine decarboxylase [Rhodoferax sp.]MCF8207928.1 adenosylmethionine decarboxylase [Rhodoferax sp.]
MAKRVKGRNIELAGFNNLTKSLSFNIYDLCHVSSEAGRMRYLETIDARYHSHHLEAVVAEVTRRIDARLLSLSTQDYEPRGASLVALLNEHQPIFKLQATGLGEGAGSLMLGHLDKSHVAIHTYPEHAVTSGIASFRVDVDIATCGMISPLLALDYLLGSFKSDIVVIDYRVRGFTRDQAGNKLFIDHDIASIRDFLAPERLQEYQIQDANLVHENIFHLKMKKKRLKLTDCVAEADFAHRSDAQRQAVSAALEDEMSALFSGRRMR